MTRLVESFHKDDDNGCKSNHKNEELPNNGNQYSNEEKNELLLDLAQIHTRLGDLQRQNDNLLPSISDYEKALKLRIGVLGKFDRKVADSHFLLAGVYAEAISNRSSGGTEEGNGGGGDGDMGGMMSAMMAGGSMLGKGTLNEEEEEEKAAEFRSSSLEHYLACGTAFAGLLANMCGVDAEGITDIANETPNAAAAAASSTATTANHHSETMATLRSRISKLQPPPASKLDEFTDIKEMMDEIQEAMDTAKETEEGLKSLGEMKANEMKKLEMKEKGIEENGGMEGKSEESIGFGTTTIGFGQPSGVAASASAVNTVSASFGASGAAVATAAAAPTMMVVKKKKKKPQAVGEESAKRVKTDG